MCWERGGIYRFWWVSLKKSDHLEELAVDRRVILKLILNKHDGFRQGYRLVTGNDIAFLTTALPMIRCCWNVMYSLVCSCRRFAGSSALTFRLG
jgi:hypothetical protein